LKKKNRSDKEKENEEDKNKEKEKGASPLTFENRGLRNRKLQVKVPIDPMLQLVVPVIPVKVTK